MEKTHQKLWKKLLAAFTDYAKAQEKGKDIEKYEERWFEVTSEVLKEANTFSFEILVTWYHYINPKYLKMFVGCLSKAARSEEEKIKAVFFSDDLEEIKQIVRTSDLSFLGAFLKKTLNNPPFFSERKIKASIFERPDIMLMDIPFSKLPGEEYFNSENISLLLDRFESSDAIFRFRSSLWPNKYLQSQFEKAPAIITRWKGLSDKEFASCQDFDGKLYVYTRAFKQWKLDPENFKSMFLSLENLKQVSSFKYLIGNDLGKQNFFYNVLGFYEGRLFKEIIKSSEPSSELFDQAQQYGAGVTKVEKKIIKKFLKSITKKAPQ